MKEIKEWFDRHESEIPATLQLDRATFYTDLPKAIDAYWNVYKIHGDKPAFNGQLYQLFLIREALEEKGIKD